MTIGLIGSWRRKTTLAKAFAANVGLPFVETSVSAICKEIGYDPSRLYDFQTRLEAQEEILRRVDLIYGKYSGGDFVTDRTPLDMAAYTLAEAIGDRVPEHCQRRLEAYINECFATTNRRFGMVFLIQPGIRIVDEPGKAVPNPAYIEHLNSLILGLSVDERLTCDHFFMPRSIVDFNDRLRALKNSVERARGRVAEQYAIDVKSGVVLIH